MPSAYNWWPVPHASRIMRLWQQVWRRQKWQVINMFPPQTYLLWPTSVEWTTHQHPQTNLMRGSGCSSVITLAIAAGENCRIETRSSSVNELLQLTKNFSSINIQHADDPPDDASVPPWQNHMFNCFVLLCSGQRWRCRHGWLQSRWQNQVC